MRYARRVLFLALAAAAVGAFAGPTGALAQFSTSYDLLNAIEDQNLSEIRELMAKCRCPNMRDSDGVPAFVLAARSGFAPVAEYFLEQGANPNIAARQSGLTALMAFARADNVAGVELLLEHGADINTADRSGETALMYAVRGRAMRALRVLVQKGADPAMANYQGQTPLDIAHANRYGMMERILTEAPAG